MDTTLHSTHCEKLRPFEINLIFFYSGGGGGGDKLVREEKSVLRVK